jgi:hypothetical protein
LAFVAVTPAAAGIDSLNGVFPLRWNGGAWQIGDYSTLLDLEVDGPVYWDFFEAFTCREDGHWQLFPAPDTPIHKTENALVTPTITPFSVSSLTPIAIGTDSHGGPRGSGMTTLSITGIGGATDATVSVSFRQSNQCVQCPSTITAVFNGFPAPDYSFLNGVGATFPGLGPYYGSFLTAPRPLEGIAAVFDYRNGSWFLQAWVFGNEPPFTGSAGTWNVTIPGGECPTLGTYTMPPFASNFGEFAGLSIDVTLS